MLLYNFSVISFAEYKEYTICLVIFSKFSDVLPAFTCASAIGNVWRICLLVNIFSPLPFFVFIANIPLLKRLRVIFRPSQGALILSKVFFSLSSFFVLALLLICTIFSKTFF